MKICKAIILFLAECFKHFFSARVSDSGTILLANVTPADSGRYTCSASNAVTGETVTLPLNFQLSVDSPRQRHPPTAPHFPLSKPNNYTVLSGVNLRKLKPFYWQFYQRKCIFTNTSVCFTGKDATLECPAAGWPPPTFTWSKYGGSIPADRTSMVPGALLLSSVSIADEGTYVCEAKNSAGPLVSCIISLQVTGIFIFVLLTSIWC